MTGEYEEDETELGVEEHKTNTTNTSTSKLVKPRISLKEKRIMKKLEKIEKEREKRAAKYKGKLKEEVVPQPISLPDGDVGTVLI